MFKTFANNELLTAADVNNYLMRQAIIRVANPSERAAIASPQQGMTIWRDDIGTIEIYYALYHQTNNPAGRTVAGWYPYGGRWIAPTLINSWSNFGQGFRDASYRTVGEMVELRGTIKGGTGVMFQLPTGYRPAANEAFLVMTNVGGGALYAQTDGNVLISAYIAGGGNGIVSLNGIRFVRDGA